MHTFLRFNQSIILIYLNRLLLVLVVFIVSLTSPVESHDKTSGFFRDTEVENIIKFYADPIFRAAGLSEEEIKIYLIKDDSLNAFVTSNKSIFLTSGLLTHSKSFNDIIGVIAHETGHLAGGHLTRVKAEIDNAELKYLFAAALGVLVGAASKNVNAANMIVRSGKAIALTELLRYSRSQESAADTAAIRYLETTKQSAKGYANFFRQLRYDQSLHGGLEQPYLSTHPLNSERLSFIEHHLAQSTYTNAQAPDKQIRDHKIIQAKLNGLFLSKKKVFEKYPEYDHSTHALYARAISNYLAGDILESISLIDRLIKKNKNYPYFYQLKGLILFKNGHSEESLPFFEKSIELAPMESLLRINLVQAQIESGNNKYLESAKTHLNMATSLEYNSLETWRLLTIVSGRLGKMGDMNLAQSELAFLKRKYKSAKQFSVQAMKKLPLGSPGWLRARDIFERTNHKIK